MTPLGLEIPPEILLGMYLGIPPNAIQTLFIYSFSYYNSSDYIVLMNRILRFTYIIVEHFFWYYSRSSSKIIQGLHQWSLAAPPRIILRIPVTILPRISLGLLSEIPPRILPWIFGVFSRDSYNNLSRYSKNSSNDSPRDFQKNFSGDSFKDSVVSPVIHQMLFSSFILEIRYGCFQKFIQGYC